MNKTRKNALRATLLALSVILGSFSGCASPTALPAETEESAALEPSAQVTEPVLQEGQKEYNGRVYEPREDLTTVLVMGLDKYERPEDQVGYTNTMQSDFLLLLVIDEGAGTCEALHLNRDTMTKIRRLGIGGGAAGSFTGQLALAHTYGSGGSDSCLNAVKAVSGLLEGVTIDHYMTLTMDAVGKINDLVGGVTVTVLHDFGEDYPELKKGEEVTLRGEQALVYVRSRMDVGDQSNLQRMERQQQYLNAMFTKLLEKNRQIPDFLRDALLQVNDAFASDMTVDQLEALGEILEGCTIKPVRSIPGEAVQGEEYIEFYVDQEALMETVIDLFYRNVN